MLMKIHIQASTDPGQTSTYLCSVPYHLSALHIMQTQLDFHDDMCSITGLQLMKRVHSSEFATGYHLAISASVQCVMYATVVSDKQLVVCITHIVKCAGDK